MSEPAFNGTVKEELERKYTILNEKDYEKYIDLKLKIKFEEVFREVLQEIVLGRELDGKEPYNNYIVINLDEPYVGDVIEILKENGHWGGRKE